MTPPSERPCAPVRTHVLLAGACLLAACLAPGPAGATLGEGATTVDSDLATLRAHRSIIRAAAYSVHQLYISGGTVVHEYVNGANQVFAVTWSGPSIPDLQPLLGVHFARYSAAAKANGRARRPVTVQQPDLVIRTAGRTRAFSGIAYLPAQVPAGVSISEIR
jgi:hypothetical protein